MIGAPEWIRTTDPRLRRPVLYPAELRALERFEQGQKLKACFSLNQIEFPVGAALAANDANYGKNVGFIDTFGGYIQH